MNVGRDEGPGPRLFGIPAQDAAVVAVIRRGPTNWCHVGRWDLTAQTYEPGAWIKATIYPQKCDLSANGRWLVYSALNPGASWAAGTVYEAVSRLPWLTALAAWEAGTTYTRGLHFVPPGSGDEVDPPDVGDAGPLRTHHGLAVTRPEQFAVERRRGWVESERTPPREAGGPWDEDRLVVMEKPNPSVIGTRLEVSGRYAAFRTSPALSGPARYRLIGPGRADMELDDVQWADWDRQGRLLVATGDGHLQIRTVDGASWQVSFDRDLSAMEPKPEPAPSWASDW